MRIELLTTWCTIKAVPVTCIKSVTLQCITVIKVFDIHLTLIKNIPSKINICGYYSTYCSTNNMLYFVSTMDSNIEYHKKRTGRYYHLYCIRDCIMFIERSYFTLLYFTSSFCITCAQYIPFIVIKENNRFTIPYFKPIFQPFHHSQHN